MGLFYDIVDMLVADNWVAGTGTYVLIISCYKSTLDGLLVSVKFSDFHNTVHV
jgi:hypothetical protein